MRTSYFSEEVEDVSGLFYKFLDQIRNRKFRLASDGGNYTKFEIA